MPLNRQRLIAFLFPLLLALPFLNRALFVDDHFFVGIAHWIKDHPTDPFSFPVDGIAPSAQMPKAELLQRIVNPLFHHYYLALWMKIGGESEIWLRLGGVLPVCFAGLFVLPFARRWTQHPLLATLLVQATPAHWLTSYSLLIDATLFLFVMAGLWSFSAALDKQRWEWAILSGICVGLGLVTKYTGVLLVTLQAAWILVYARNKFAVRQLATVWFVGALIFIGSAVLVQMRYGVNHLTASSDLVLHWPSLGRIMILLVFVSGVTLVPLLMWLRSSPKQAAIAAVMVLGLGAVLASPLLGVHVSTAFWMALWLVNGLTVLGSAIRYLKTSQNVDDMFIGLWIVLFLMMMSVVMQWTAGRYCMIVAPAVVFATVRFTERALHARAWLTGALGVTLAWSGSLAYADYSQAQTGRQIVGALRGANLLEGPNRYYFSDAFNLSYMNQAGWQPCGDPSSLRPGDLIVTPERSLPLEWFSRSHPSVRLVRSFEFPSHFPFRVMDNPSDAGFYASAWGPLPFSTTTGPWERFHLFEIIAPS